MRASKLEFVIIADLPVACAVQVNIKITTKSDDADIS